MKKRKILSMFLLIFTLFGVFNFFNPSEVKAATYNETLSHPKTPNVYYTRRGGGKPYMSAQYEQYTMNGKVVYCIEPGVDITNTSYLGYDGLQASPYDDATNKKIELIGHYGYDYPGHQTLRYRMATQALIWETTGGQIIEFWTEQYGYGDPINVSAERNEIMRLVNAHYNKPSFNGSSMEVIIGKEYKLTDSNGLMGEYELYKADNLKVRIEGNNIYVTPLYDTYKAFNYLKKGTLEFTKTDYSTSEPIPNVEFNIFTEKDELIYSGKTDENGKIIVKELAVGKYYIVEVNPIEGYVSSDEKVLFEIKENGEIVKAKMTNKKISSTLKITKDDEDGSLLSGVKFGVYNLEDKLISEHTTDENGYFEVVLEYGKYYFKEISTLDSYVLSDEKIYFDVVEEGAVIEKTITNKFRTGTLEFTKTDLVNGEVIPNTLIEIYNSKDELVFSGKTDENGQVVIEELRYGKYYIIEKEAATGFVITDEKVYFEILENGKIVKAEMKNRPIYGTLEFTKTDISTSEPLPNTVIEIYTEKDELVFSGKTDENGQVIIEELRYGKYYILEKEAPEGYILTEEKMAFEILEDGEIVKANMVNEKVVIEVPNTGLNDYFVLEIISGLLMISGIGVIIYAKKKNKKQ